MEVVGVHIAAATWDRPKMMFQTSGVLPEKFLKTHQMSTAETDETGFWRFCHYAIGAFSIKLARHCLIRAGVKLQQAINV
jgi:hypothetical protein